MRGRGWLVREALKRAEAGRPDDARVVLDFFIQAVEGKQISGRTAEDSLLLDYLAERLGLFLREGGDLERALGVKRPNRRPKSDKLLELSIARAAAVELLMRDGYKKTAAVEAVVNASGVDRRTVMRDCRGWIRGGLPDEYLRHTARLVSRSPNFPPLKSD